VMAATPVVSDDAVPAVVPGVVGGAGAAAGGVVAPVPVSFFDYAANKLNLGGRFYEKALSESGADAAKMLALYDTIKAQTGRDDTSFADVMRTTEFSFALTDSDEYDALIDESTFASIAAKIVRELKTSPSWETLKAPYTLDARLKPFDVPGNHFRDRILVKKGGSDAYTQLSIDDFKASRAVLDPSDALFIRSKTDSKTPKSIDAVVAAAAGRARTAGIDEGNALVAPHYANARLPLYKEKYRTQKTATAAQVVAVQEQLDAEKLKVRELQARLASASSEETVLGGLRSKVGIRTGAPFSPDVIKEWKNKAIKLSAAQADIGALQGQISELKAALTAAEARAAASASGGAGGAGAGGSKPTLASAIGSLTIPAVGDRPAGQVAPSPEPSQFGLGSEGDTSGPKEGDRRVQEGEPQTFRSGRWIVE